MMFALRAAFWIAVVAYFMPGDPAADAIAGSARQAVAAVSETNSAEAYGAVARVCMDDPDLCIAGVNAIDDAQNLAVEGLNALAAVLDDRDSSARN